MRTQRGAGLTLGATFAALAVVLTACAAEVKLAEGAASQVFHAVGENPGEIKVAASTVASRYHVSERDVAAVASQADSYSGWTEAQSAADRMVSIAIAVKRSKPVSAGVDVACKWGLGEMNTNAEFNVGLASATAGMAASDAQAFHDATAELAKRLRKIETEGSPTNKAAAAWFCYGYAVVPVPERK